MRPAYRPSGAVAAFAVAASLALPAPGSRASVRIPDKPGESSAIHRGDFALRAPGPVRTAALANGLTVRLYTADFLESRLTSLDGEPIIPLDNGRYFRVITRVSDPAVYNKGDGAFHPFDEQEVLSALSALSHPSLGIEVSVYLLPFPRRELLVSSTSGNEIFLSPHVLDIAPSVSAYIVSHEMGHVLHNRYLPGVSRGWARYRAVRGIGDMHRFSDAGAHAYRPREIFAEDFRVLFGRADATFGGNVENSEIVRPREVPGLKAFFVALGSPREGFGPQVAASSFPNPFNPETRIHVELPAGVLPGQTPVSVQIYDVRGALVRELYDGAALSGVVDVAWDGTDSSGRRVASANYFALVRAGRARTTVKLVLLK